ncbi:MULTISPECIES: acyltransferase family protein [Polaromonas]|uniref:Acyltransferase family protein n=1 Tax=Polaromonas aquatica TaxID=332657 RepID=A0ABW1TV02_9BURK
MKSVDRVLGWDLLRGLCAIAVAGYHLLMWQKVIDIHTFGSYGVYLFFVLSGASLAYTYIDRIAENRFSFTSFMWVRYLRLAPLYLALMLLVLPWKLLKDGATADLWVAYLLNASLLFGFYNPSTHAVLVGGWSLGIEVIFYLLFPFLVWSLRSRWIAWGVFGALLALQITWIALTIGAPSGYFSNAEAYHQAPAFAAYFMGGCLLGAAKRRGALKALPFERLGLIGLVAGFALMFAVNPVRQGDELTGWRGILLCSLCFTLVSLASRLDLTKTTAGVARHFGDATYGVYLLHPVIFFGLAFVVSPRLGIPDPGEWPMPARLLLTAVVVFVSFCLALLSERYFEKPIRQRSKLLHKPLMA